jgi:hypothetical protein
VTAPVDVRVPVERLTLVGRLTRLAGHVQAVVDDGGLVAGFASAVLGQLGPAVADAEVEADQIEMLRAQAADRERARGGLQAARRDLGYLVGLIDGMEPAALSRSWLIERLTGSIGRLDESLKPDPVNCEPAEVPIVSKEMRDV